MSARLWLPMLIAAVALAAFFAGIYVHRSQAFPYGLIRSAYIALTGSSSEDGAPAQDAVSTTFSVERPSLAVVCDNYTQTSLYADLLVYACAPSGVGLTEGLEGRSFDQPVDLFAWPGGGVGVVDRGGSITLHAPKEPPRLLLDISARTDCCEGEQGMLSASLDPDFDEFPFLYVYYHVNPVPDGYKALGRLSRFPVVDGRASPDQEVAILELPQPDANHNGGAVRFGPDGMLHLGLGDSRRSEDAQRLDTLRGKIIRIDVRNASQEQPYRAPEDNPLFGREDARPEIFAWGLRNPWRMAFDPQGRLLVADVGWRHQEEVSLATSGANLGWPLFEGTKCLHGRARCADSADAVFPLVSYGREQGCAVIGGATVQWMDDAYVFGDLCSRKIWALARSDGGYSMQELAVSPRPILSIAEGEPGKIYVLTLNGPILLLQAASP